MGSSHPNTHRWHKIRDYINKDQEPKVEFQCLIMQLLQFPWAVVATRIWWHWMVSTWARGRAPSRMLQWELRSISRINTSKTSRPVVSPWLVLIIQPETRHQASEASRISSATRTVIPNRKWIIIITRTNIFRESRATQMPPSRTDLLEQPMRTEETEQQDTVTARRLPQPKARSCRITSSFSLHHLVIVLRIST